MTFDMLVVAASSSLLSQIQTTRVSKLSDHCARFKLPDLLVFGRLEVVFEFKLHD